MGRTRRMTDKIPHSGSKEEPVSDDPVKQRLIERIQAYQEGERDAEPNNAIYRARLGRTLGALMEIRDYALAVVGASEAYGQPECARVMQEVADMADKGLG
jgi:hypothetical protein